MHNRARRISAGQKNQAQFRPSAFDSLSALAAVIGQIRLNATPLRAQGDDCAYIFVRRIELDVHHRFADLFYLCGLWQSRWIFNPDARAGAVVNSSMPNSRSSRSCTMSICNRPRRPQRKPEPSACDDSGSYWSAASFSFNFSSDSRSASYWFASIGYSPANTCGLASLKPGRGAEAGWPASVTVSPTFAAVSVLMPAITKPT